MQEQGAFKIPMRGKCPSAARKGDGEKLRFEGNGYNDTFLACKQMALNHSLMTRSSAFVYTDGAIV